MYNVVRIDVAKLGPICTGQTHNLDGIDPWTKKRGCQRWGLTVLFCETSLWELWFCPTEWVGGCKKTDNEREAPIEESTMPVDISLA